MPVPADIAVLRLGPAVIFRVEITFLIHNFGKGQVQDLAGMTVQHSLHIAGDLLAEINDKLSFGRGKSAGGGHTLVFPDFFTLLGNQGIPGTFEAQDVSVHGRFEGGVKDFPVIDFGEAHPAFRYLPVGVRADDFPATVFINNFQLGKQAGRIVLQALLVGGNAPPRHGAVVPSFSHQNVEGVVFGQQACDIVFLVLEPFVVGSPARCQDKLTDPSAIQPGLVHT